MNVTRDVMTDLLPVYFSDEASEDTRRLMEEYFRQDPDFERIARRAAMPLEQLRRTAPVAAEAEREKCDLQWARKEFLRRRVAFSMALLFTLAPLMLIYHNGHLVWTAFLDDPWLLALFWCVAGLFWFEHVTRFSRRTNAMLASIFWVLLPMVPVFHLFLPGWQTDLRGRLDVAFVMWLGALFPWAGYLWLNRWLSRHGCAAGAR